MKSPRAHFMQGRNHISRGSIAPNVETNPKNVSALAAAMQSLLTK